MGIFVAEIEGRRIAAFGDMNRDDALEWIECDVFRSGLAVLENEDRPLWDETADISLHDAFPDEAERWKVAHRNAVRDGFPERETYVMYLVEVSDPHEDHLQDDEDRDDGEDTRGGPSGWGRPY